MVLPSGSVDKDVVKIKKDAFGNEVNVEAEGVIASGRNDNSFGEHVHDNNIDAIMVEGGTSTGSHANGSGVSGMNDMLFRERDSRSTRGLES